MPGQPLAVPMQLDALVVNQSVLARDSFRWWQFNYLSLSHWKSPEPIALDRSVGGQQPGVYLSWTLPDALRHSERRLAERRVPAGAQPLADRSAQRQHAAAGDRLGAGERLPVHARR